MISSGVCEWIHFKVATIALVSFCVVASFFAIQSARVYSAPPGYSPPNTSSVSFAVRVSARILKSLNLFCSSVAAGSSITAACTLPCSIAATAVAARPMPTTLAEVGSMPFLASRYLRKKSVDEPGRRDAHGLAGEILDRLDVFALRRYRQHHSGIAVVDHEGLQRLSPWRRG
jgi:hypothetical protein